MEAWQTAIGGVCGSSRGRHERAMEWVEKQSELYRLAPAQCGGSVSIASRSVLGSSGVVGWRAVLCCVRSLR